MFIRDLIRHLLYRWSSVRPAPRRRHPNLCGHEGKIGVLYSVIASVFGPNLPLVLHRLSQSNPRNEKLPQAPSNATAWVENFHAKPRDAG